MLTTDPRIEAQINEQPYPLLFMTISGAHLYGFPSPDSDYDLRGSHLLPLKEVLGLPEVSETVETTVIREGLEIDIVTHDLRKYFSMVLKRNGYVLEQILSPLILRTSPGHVTLKELARQCVTRHHSHHYLGMAATQWKLYQKEEPHRVKPLLYVFRGLLTGLHLMQTGEVEANLGKLNEQFQLPYVDELIALKQGGTEKGKLPAGEYQFYEQEYRRLVADLEDASQNTTLPAEPAREIKDKLNDLLLELRKV